MKMKKIFLLSVLGLFASMQMASAATMICTVSSLPDGDGGGCPSNRPMRIEIQLETMKVVQTDEVFTENCSSPPEPVVTEGQAKFTLTSNGSTRIFLTSQSASTPYGFVTLGRFSFATEYVGPGLQNSDSGPVVCETISNPTE